jgi:hypothetical protein
MLFPECFNHGDNQNKIRAGFTLHLRDGVFYNYVFRFGTFVPDWRSQMIYYPDITL